MDSTPSENLLVWHSLWLFRKSTPTRSQLLLPGPSHVPRAPQSGLSHTDQELAGNDHGGHLDPRQVAAFLPVGFHDLTAGTQLGLSHAQARVSSHPLPLRHPHPGSPARWRLRTLCRPPGPYLGSHGYSPSPTLTLPPPSSSAPDPSSSHYLLLIQNAHVLGQQLAGKANIHCSLCKTAWLSPLPRGQAHPPCPTRWLWIGSEEDCESQP